ncbi:PAS domain-containing protein [Streptomyces sp. NPDC050264]|uniref:PAS domain-containing protein n=1 Tax=Streptomyces sp. NPDC050264 TaxID=3155038 RepID=UPI003438FFD4
MPHTGEFGEEHSDFARRVAELRAARAVPADESPAVLDAALLELGHVVRELWPHQQDPRPPEPGARPSRSATADRREQQLLRAVFQGPPLPVALADRESMVRRLNVAATTFTGVREEYATGHPLTALLAHADRAAFRSQVAAVARDEGDRGLSVRLQQSPRAAIRTTVLGADDEGVRAIAGQNPAAGPLVVEAARGGSPALLVRPQDPGALGVDASGAPVLVLRTSRPCCACR